MRDLNDSIQFLTNHLEEEVNEEIKSATKDCVRTINEFTRLIAFLIMLYSVLECHKITILAIIAIICTVIVHIVTHGEKFKVSTENRIRAGILADPSSDKIMGNIEKSKTLHRVK